MEHVDVGRAQADIGLPRRILTVVDRPLTWLLQANLRDQAFLARLEAALDQLGEDRQRVELVPFSPEVPALSFEAAERAIVCYGPSFVPYVRSI